jgi:hypothetical protein
MLKTLVRFVDPATKRWRKSANWQSVDFANQDFPFGNFFDQSATAADLRV